MRGRDSEHHALTIIAAHTDRGEECAVAYGATDADYFF
jgi:hypothetical protein